MIIECIQIDAARIYTSLIKDTSHDILGWDSLKYIVSKTNYNVYK